jgi:hypothetical protein
VAAGKDPTQERIDLVTRDVNFAVASGHDIRVADPVIVRC